VHWDCWKCHILGPNATSQKAEIIGAYSAALLVLDYITNTYVNGEPIPEFVFRGDSSYVCNKFPSSEELSEHVIRTVRATNTSNKEEMLLLLDALTNINFKWRFEWVPRQYNAPADELANAVMDDRQPCRDIVAYEPQAAVTLQEDALRRLWDLARAKRVPLFHRLPFEAIPVWKQVCDLILSHEAFRISRLATLLLAPLALLQRNKDNIKQRLIRPEIHDEDREAAYEAGKGSWPHRLDPRTVPRCLRRQRPDRPRLHRRHRTWQQRRPAHPPSTSLSHTVGATQSKTRY
jgi:ribonuclease HI